VAVLDLNTFDASQLTVLEVLDMADIAGVPPEELGGLMEQGQPTVPRMRMLYAMAWCIARRGDASLTFDEVCTWKLEVIGETTEALTERTAKRAKVIVGAAVVSGLPPVAAGQLTLAELGVYNERNRAARRRRKAG